MLLGTLWGFALNCPRLVPCGCSAETPVLCLVCATTPLCLPTAFFWVLEGREDGFSQRKSYCLEEKNFFACSATFSILFRQDATLNIFRKPHWWTLVGEYCAAPEAISTALNNVQLLTFKTEPRHQIWGTGLSIMLMRRFLRSVINCVQTACTARDTVTQQSPTDHREQNTHITSLFLSSDFWVAADRELFPLGCPVCPLCTNTHTHTSTWRKQLKLNWTKWSKNSSFLQIFR